MIGLDLRSVLRRGVAEIIVEEELVKLLESGRPLRLKQGFDPSCPDIHLGHAVGLRKLRQFQEMGHQVVLIVGDWTARIGDPSGESATRPMLSAEEVRTNAQTYMSQFFKIVDRKRTEVRWQSEWLSEFNLGNIMELTSKFTVAQFLAREDFNNRFRSGRPVAITELLYPVLQAYDSVVVKADVEFGGIDQKFNCLVGRELQEKVGQTPQQVFLVTLLVGTDGSQKMSKSLGNYIAVDDPPDEMYGKVLSIPDYLIIQYFELVTDVSDEEVGQFKQQLDSQSVNPMLLKKRLAREVVSQFHSPETVRNAEVEFERIFQKREVPEDILERPLSFAALRNRPIEIAPSQSLGFITADTTEVLWATGIVKSRSEAKRLLLQGAIEIDGRRVTSNFTSIRDGSTIKVGKRRFVRIVDADKK